MAEKLHTRDNHTLAYHKTIHEQTINTTPTIIFLGGLMSDMNGTKAVAIEQYCKTQKYNYIRFDYVGHGESSGSFTDGTISIWKNNVLSVIDELTDNAPLILIGSSLGGWLMLLAALERPERIQALLGIASAPDFTENLMWDIFSDEIKTQLEKKGIFQMPSDYNDAPYPITHELIKDGRSNLLLSGPININCPIRLIHGLKDDDVPYKLSIEIAKQCTSTDIQILLDKTGDHRMSSERIITIIENELTKLIHLLS